MQRLSRFAGIALLLGVLLVLSTARSLAVATLTQQIDPQEANVGDPVIVTLTVKGGSIGTAQLPAVDGLSVGGSNLQIKSEEDDKGGFVTTVALITSLTATRAGDFTIPAFDLHTMEGDVLHVQAMKLHVTANGTAPMPVTTIPTTHSGPVVMPPTDAAPGAPPNGNPSANGTTMTPPRDPDGGPAKVFIIITPQTTDAYVGQAIPMQIDFYIRMEVNAAQNSLPTIKGSDFLMNDFTHRGSQRVGVLEGQEYERETWITAISAPKSGDFPLSMARDTYWVKSLGVNSYDPYSGVQPPLAHEPISSNQLTIHVHPLPEAGRPDHFTGAIGQFQVTGEAEPDAVAFGDPVTLRFTIRGQGNFDYVRCPALASDPEWKTYAPRSTTNYLEESHTNAVKIFEQSVIALKNGNVPLPAASFSYFDPGTRQYVTVPMILPDIVVTGQPTPLASESLDDTNASLPVAAPRAEFLPNRQEIGSPQMSLAPAYRQPWFWGVQTGLISLPVLGALFLILRTRLRPDNEGAERALRRRSLQQEEEAMAEAVRRNDAMAFFLAARHSIQLQLGAQWKISPEALTFVEIRRHNPALAATLQPLFKQADEVIYSGRPQPGLDLAQWHQRIRIELLQPQPA